MSNISSIVHIPAGQIADKAFMTEALAKFPTVIGFAIQHENQLITESHKTSMKYDDLDVIVGNNTKEGHRVVLLGNWSNFENVEDVGPYVLEDRQGNPVCAIFLEGDFSDYASQGDKHIDEFNVWFDELGEKIEKMYIAAGEDHDKFVASLKDPKFQKIACKTFSHRGQFVLLTHAGEPIKFGKLDDELSKEYSWGWASNAHGLTYTEKAPEPELPLETPKPSILDRLRGKTASASPPPTAPDVKNVAPAAPKTDTKAASTVDPGAVSNVKLTMMSPPPKLKGGARNHWLRLFNAKEPGDLPADHQSNKCQISVAENLVEFAKRDVESTKDMRKLTDEVKKAIAGGPVKATTLDTGKSTVREKATNYTGMSGVLDVKQKEKAMSAIADYIGLKKTPLEIQKAESTSPVFSSEIGMSFEELLFVGADGFAKAIDGDTKIAVAIITEFKQQLIQRSGIKLEDLVAGTKGEEPKVVNTEKVNDLPVKTAAPAAATSDGLSFLRRPAAA